MQEYNTSHIEKKWQKIWKDSEYFKTNLSSNESNTYILEMLPYPSGKIHMGHVRNYSIGDTIARFLKLNGKNVFHPMGWDSFGLPAENAAIENKIHPSEWTLTNIQEMKNQLSDLGLSYDWNNEIKTCTPEYYKWTQWLFLQFYKNNLVEKRKGEVNFCNSCNTVLANEQVLDNLCWRCNNEVEKKSLSQWYMKITDYAQPLLDDISLLQNNWPERVLNMQKQWIGKSSGTEVIFEVQGYNETITAFTTRPDTLFGVTYLALAFDHPFIQKILDTSSKFHDIREFINHLVKNPFEDSPTTPKEGVMTGFFAEHPLTSVGIPIYIANFVLSSYGTGAVMCVPAHDERDFEFAKKYDLNILQVIQPSDDSFKLPYTGSGSLINSSNNFNNMPSEEAKEAITQELIRLKKGQKKTNYKLKDWLISRQRYWGTPIPVVYCGQCGILPVDEKDLPVLLPKDVQFNIGENPLNTSESFKNTSCPKCAAPATRETDTMDTFMDSSWYFIRYLSAQDKSQAIDTQKTKNWLPVNTYIGGIEHAVMHLLYSRFFYKVLYKLDLVPNKEPFEKLITQGMVIAPSYYCKKCKQYKEYSFVKDDSLCPDCENSLLIKTEKMSKSKKNGINPDSLIHEFGVDAIRVFILFAAPIDKDLEWSYKGVTGSLRFLKRFYTLCEQYKSSLFKATNNPFVPDEKTLSPQDLDLLKNFHKTIYKVTNDIQTKYQFNTAIASLMEFLNEIIAYTKKDSLINEDLVNPILQQLSVLLFPFAPHTSEECYSFLQKDFTSIYEASWPQYQEKYLNDDSVTYIIQINGKPKLTLKTNKDISLEDLKALIKEDHFSFYQKLSQQTIIKEIFVPHKIVNFVVK